MFLAQCITAAGAMGESRTPRMLVVAIRGCPSVPLFSMLSLSMRLSSFVVRVVVEIGVKNRLSAT
jgi:hypothetical protein